MAKVPDYHVKAVQNVSNPATQFPIPVSPFSPKEQPNIFRTSNLSEVDLEAELSMCDLNDIHAWLWIAGSRGNISPLHHQRVILRQIIPSEHARLHLVWFDRYIYIKPLADYLFDAATYETSLSGPLYAHLRPHAIGFLRSYCMLVRSPLDLAIAHDLHLITSEVTWPAWSKFRAAVLANTHTTPINPRYEYGELRLARLNIPWRLTFRGLTYFTVHREYGTYFNEYFKLLITVFAFVATILTAMQVLVGVGGVPELVEKVCYWFSVVVLIVICAVFAYIILLFVLMFGYNACLAALAQRQKAMEKEAAGKS